MIWKLFFSALAIRSTYALVMFDTMGNAGLMGFDSYAYHDAAQKFAQALAVGSVHGWDWLGYDPTIMPIFNGLISLCSLLFGNSGTLAYVLMQGILDSGTCVLVFLTARAINPAYAIAAGVAAVINPTQFVMSGLYYPDTPFVFFVALFLFGAVRWIRFPSNGNAVLIAVGLGCAALIRILILPWTALILIVLFGVAALRARLSAALVGGLVGVALVVGLCAGVVLARNVVTYDSWALTSQGGRHFQTVVPWVRQAFDGTPWAQGQQELMDLTALRYPTPPKDVFEESRREEEVAAEAWRRFGVAPTVKAWLYGAIINLGSPGIILSPPLIQIPRTGFYATPGASMAEKAKNFIFHSESPLYSWALLAGILGVVIIRLIQAVSLFPVLGQAWRDRATMLPIAAIMALWCGYILAVNGPVASPKYRLPLEPVLNLLTGIGFYTLHRRCVGVEKRPGSAL